MTHLTQIPIIPANKDLVQVSDQHQEFGGLWARVRSDVTNLHITVRSGTDAGLEICIGRDDSSSRVVRRGVNLPEGVVDHASAIEWARREVAYDAIAVFDGTVSAIEFAEREVAA